MTLFIDRMAISAGVQTSPTVMSFLRHAHEEVDHWLAQLHISELWQPELSKAAKRGRHYIGWDVLPAHLCTASNLLIPGQWISFVNLRLRLGVGWLGGF